MTPSPRLPVDSPVVHTHCRICHAPLAPVLSLGSLYLSDFPHSAGTKVHAPIPLDVAACTASACGLVQLTHTTPPAWMYRTYWYRSGVNESMIAELYDIVYQIAARVDLPSRAIVVDIGANDGTLLQQYALLRLGHPLTTVAYEPASNLYEVLRPHATVLYPEFFRVRDAWDATAKARAVTSIAMFYDLEDPHTFVEDITKILHPKGVWVIQQAYLPAMLANHAYDNIGHEHLAYYDLHSLQPLLEAHGLEVVDVELRDINGGSFRTYVQWRGGPQPISPRVAALYAAEAHPAVTLADFAAAVPRLKDQLLSTLATYQHTGGVVDLYGASTKANTLLGYCGIDARTIRQGWERSPEKWGRYVGTSGIPIVSEAVGRNDPPAALLGTIWQFREPLLVREAAYLAQGGRIIFPLPQVETVQHG